MTNQIKVATQLSYEVTENEKQVAEKALIIFNITKNLLTKSNDYLNIIRSPFINSPEISYDQLYKFRAALRRFRDKAIENFNKFKVASFKCISIMNNFASDTQTIKLMKSFINAIEELEAKVNIFAEIFDDLKNKNFTQNIIKKVEEIQKKCDEIKDLIDDRLKAHIQNNILSTNWVNSVGNELQMSIEKKKPLMVDIYHQNTEEQK